LHDFLPAKASITATLVDINDLDAVEAAITSKTRVIYAESIANPTLRVADIPPLADIAHRHGLKLVIDNTFSPLILSPKLLGADIVVHSMTKFIGGASDHIAGAICADKEFILSLMDLHTGALMLLGPTMDPQVAFNINLRIAHLPLRMTEHGRRAQLFAERLQGLGLDVNYPGLPEHPDHARMSELHCSDYGYGGILTLDLGSEERANALMDMLQNDYRFGYMAVSLGYYDTLMSCSGSTTSSEMTDEDKAVAGISPGLVRMSVGFTGTTEQRWRQLYSALERLGLVHIGAVGAGAGKLRTRPEGRQAIRLVVRRERAPLALESAFKRGVSNRLRTSRCYRVFLKSSMRCRGSMARLPRSGSTNTSLSSRSNTVASDSSSFMAIQGQLAQL
jgi:methionine-gamma-lyase